MMDSAMRSKSFRVLRNYVAAIALPLLIMGAAMLWIPKAWVGGAIFSVVMLVAAVSGFPFAGRAWYLIDETAREAHKSAWFWGGSFGAFIGMLAFVFWFRFGGLHSGLWLGVSPHQAFALVLLGAAGIVFAQAVGYAVAWALWWVRRR